MVPGAIPPAGVVWLKNSARVARWQARQPRSGPTDDPSRHLAAPHRCPTAVVCGCRCGALLAFKLHTQFGADVLLTAIAAYVPLSLSFLPVLAWLCGRRRESGRADAQAAPGWPGYLAAATGIVMLAGYHVAAAPYLAECGILLLLAAADLWLVRKESAYFLALAG